jgi:SpoIID/LytB domain protein
VLFPQGMRFRGTRKVVPVVPLATAVAVIAASLIIPVAGPDAPTLPTPTEISAPDSSPHSEQRIALTGIDPDVVDAGNSAMANYDALLEGALVGDALYRPENIDDEHDHDHHSVALDVELEPAIATRSATTKPFTLVGISATEPFEHGSQILVRVKESDGWSEWSPLPVSEHLPDADEAADIFYGTEPLLTDEATGVEVRIDTPGGIKPVEPTVVLLDAPVIDSDSRLPDPVSTDGPFSQVAASAVSAPMPTIITRSQWGANESQVRNSPKYAPTIKAAFIHHTASKNDYTPEQSAAQVRNLYNWFTRGLKYSDMAYNFLVDRYGRLYEGRGGGIDRAVVGGHTAGFNDQTFAVSAIGNFQKFKPNDPEMGAIIDSVSSLLAWKLSMNHRDPNGQTSLVSDSGSGTSKYKPGQTATAQVVSGHGDIGATSCPGQHLSRQIPAIRAAAGAKMGASMINPAAAPSSWGTATPVRIGAITNAPLQWTLSIRSQCGDVVRSLSGAQEAPGQLAIDWDMRNDAGEPVPPGTYSIAMNSTGNGEALYPWFGQARVLATNESPTDPCAPPASFTLTGSGFGHGVGMSQWGARAMAVSGMDARSILSYYYQNTSVDSVTDDMEISVNIEYQKARVDMRGEALDASGGGLEITVGGVITQGAPADTFQFQQNAGQVRVVKISGGASTVIGQGPNATVRPIGATLVQVVNKGGSFTSPGNRFRYGFIEVTPVKAGGGSRVNAVNKLRLHEEYLYGIAEVPSSWPDAALQAQVIASRTYALSKIRDGIRASCNCHLDDGYGPFIDQTFVGWSKQSGAQGNRWVDAVNATLTSPNTGLAVLHNGQPIKAFYGASNGGASQASVDVWGGVLPYSVSVPDPYSLDASNPDRVWTKTITQAEAAKAFGVAAVWGLNVTERHASGAVKTIAATNADNTSVTRTGGQMRSLFGLKSSFVTAIDGNAGVPVNTPAAPGDAVAVPGATASERSVLISTQPTATQPAGKPFAVKAKVTPAKKGLKTWFQQQVNGEWKTIAKKKTSKKGNVNYRVKEAWPPSSTLLYRIVSVKKKAIVGTSSELSIGVVPSVTPRTIALVTDAAVTVSAGKGMKISAVVRPKKKGLTVWRQVLVSGDPETGEWRTADSKRTVKNGRVTFRIKKATPAGATYAYRLLVVDNRQAAGVSPIINVTVTE